MHKRAAFLFSIFLVTTLFADANDEKLDDVRDLQGTWHVIELEANGNRKPAEEIDGMKLVVKQDELWVVKSSGPDPKLKFRLDSQKSPKTIDLIGQEGNDKEKVVLGIYSLEKGQLRLCINLFGTPSYRPVEFKTREGDGVGFAILDREKAK
jgi:uncharacterized protein (TIGR03067 family)